MLASEQVSVEARRIPANCNAPTNPTRSLGTCARAARVRRSGDSSNRACVKQQSESSVEDWSREGEAKLVPRRAGTASRLQELRGGLQKESRDASERAFSYA